MSSKVSVIIPAQKINQYLLETIKSLYGGSYKNFEIIIILDEKNSARTFSKTKILVLKNSAPAEKRDYAARIAKGEILAFIDDDAYPSRDWLKNALPLFNNVKISAVCGPGVTPPTDTIKQKVSGWISSVKVGSGPYTYRFTPESSRFVDDFPSMNFLIRKRDFKKAGGFETKFWPGEDTKLCLDIVKQNKKIFYHPDILVFHHRKPVFKKHLMQNGRYGLHRGYFAKVLPQTSRRLSYFLPSILTIGLLIGPSFYLISKELFSVYVLSLFVYLLGIIGTAWYIFTKEKDIRIALLFIPAIIITHLFYGLKFLQGFFFTNKLKI